MLSSLLVGAALSCPLCAAAPPEADLNTPLATLGQPQEMAAAAGGNNGAPGPPTTAVPEQPGAIKGSAPTPAPDRWLLMKALQGTWPGDVLDGNRLQVSGWLEGSFTAGTVGHNQLPLSFNYRADEPVLDQGWVRIERSVVTSGTTEPTFGFRSDWLFGTDYRFTLARGIFNGQLTARNGEPAIYGVDPVEFYGEAYVPTVANGLDAKVGRFFAPFGTESVEAVSNPLLSHSYTFNATPFTQTGLLATLTLTPVWQIQGGIVLGGDIFLNPADQATVIAGLQWTQPGGRNTVKVITLLDSGRYDQASQQKNVNEVDVLWQHVIAQRQGDGGTTPILTYNLEMVGGYETNLPDEAAANGDVNHLGTATFLGVVNYLNYALSPRVVATARLEFFDDPQGFRTETAPGATAEEARGLYTALTLGMTFKPLKDVMIQPEIRYDYNGESRPFNGQHGLLTSGVGVILRY